MPETSRWFECWQSASKWRPLPWLANPGGTAKSPHVEGRERHPSHQLDSRKRGREAIGGRGSVEDVPTQSNAYGNAKTRLSLRVRCILVRVHINTPLTKSGTRTLILVNWLNCI